MTIDSGADGSSRTDTAATSGFGAGLDASARTASGPGAPTQQGGGRGDGGSDPGGSNRGETGAVASPSRRGKRGGRRRSKRAKAASTSGPAEEGAAAAPRSESSAPAADAAAGERAPSRRRRRSRGKRAEPASDEPREAEAAPRGAERAPDDAATASEAGAEPAVRKKRSRRGRRSKKKAGGQAPEAPAEVHEDEPAGSEDAGSAAAEETEGAAARKRRRRGSRGGRGRKKKATPGGRQEDDEARPVGVDLIPGEDDDFPESESGSDDEEEDGGGRRGRSRRKASSSRSRSAEPAKPTVARTQRILVNALQAEETRVAVVEDGKIRDFHMVVERYNSYVNDIYRGRVVNLEPAIGAAFVDFGQGRNGFLHASDVMAIYGEKGFKLEQLLTARVDEDELESEGVVGDFDPGDGDEKSRGGGKGGRARSQRRVRKRMPIESLLKKGSMIVGQITKDAIGDKGPTLTTYISIPGRYIVLMPSLARTGVSRKIEDDRERKRLKRILQSLDIPEGMGVIVRTAGTSKTKKELKRDLDYLLAVWEDFSKRLVSGRNPMPLYQESDVAIRTMRDLFSEKTEAVLVDDKEVYERMVEFTEKLMPEHVDRIVLHEGPRPLFHTYGVEQDFERIFSRRVELPSGGSIVFDPTEALVAIDVNSGRTRGEGAGFEDIALKTNLEAVPEIARQIRLRDLGGIIVCDFIDMTRMSSRRQVERALRDAMADDRARSKMGRISQFGLLELTRQRLGPGLSKLVFDPCSACRGTGQVRTARSKAQAILRRLGAALLQKGFSSVELRAHPETVEYLRSHCAGELDALRQSSGRELNLTVVEAQVEDSVLRYLRADGREVRPGGRRKR